ncbi:aspartate aminotransferase [Rhodotorula toruloides]|uniref:Aspartate aminotransferase n=1 Tax=Rhodotorula toruloides TaxID=5286 RepID=A0A511KNP1_RHOTO|nr:aspartate aminotransferase [Rhodotorula toruloides]
MNSGYALNPYVRDSAAPPIPLAGQWGARFEASPDKPLLNLAQGVPGSPPPLELQKKLADAAAEPATTSYGALQGEEGLRQALAKDVNGVYGTDNAGEEQKVTVDDIVITAGCNLAFYASMLALARPGDEIILPSPSYFNHAMSLDQLGLTLVPLRCRPPTFLPSVDGCAALITPRTKAVILVTPNNPTGAIYPPGLLKQFAELAAEKKIALVMDETYRDFLEGRPHNLFAESSWRRYLIHLFSFSKSYAIPGHRLGAIIATQPFLRSVYKLMDCIQTCPPRPAQQAIQWAVEAMRPWREATRDELAQRQRVFKELLEDVEGWEVVCGGAYFAYVKHPFAGVPSELVARRLGERVGVVVLPGTFFSPPFENVDEDRYIRFAVANVSEETLRLIPARLEELNKLWPTLKA